MGLSDILNKEYKAKDMFSVCTVFAPYPVWALFVLVFNQMGQAVPNVFLTTIFFVVSFSILAIQLYSYSNTDKTTLKTSLATVNCILILVPLIFVIIDIFLGSMMVGLGILFVVIPLLVTGILPVFIIWYIALLVKFIKSDFVAKNKK